MDYTFRVALDDNFFYLGVAGVVIAFNRADIGAVIAQLEEIREQIDQENAQVAYI